MAKNAKFAWGIDVGNCALKAIKLALAPEGVEVVDFAVIEHEKILSQPEMLPEQKHQLVSEALDKFLDEHDTSGSSIVVAMPGQTSLSRFIPLPPVEAKRIPDLVKYEAVQQIPFPIDEVEWDWQTFQEPDSPEVEVGIFAIKSDLVKRALSPFAKAGCIVNTVQVAPMALYNFLKYDKQSLSNIKGDDAIVTLDIGAESTDMVISHGNRIWARTINIGGNHFTAAVQKAFKLSFSKAENIKRTANTSKYARQIFQAMRPVFSDLAAQIQRSLGFYSSSNRDVNYKEVLALGSAMKLPGLVKFLQQSLSLPVKRLDNFETAQISPEISITEFNSHLPGFGVAYGLALQGIGLANINCNLLPREIVAQAVWKRKKRWFIAASATFVLSGALSMALSKTQASSIEKAENEPMQQVAVASDAVRNNSSKENELKSQIEDLNKKMDDYKKYYDSRTLPIHVYEAIKSCLPGPVHTKDVNQLRLYEALTRGDIVNLTSIPRGQREQVYLSRIQIIYTDDLSQPISTIIAERGKSGMESRGSLGLGGGGGDEMMMDGMGMDGMGMGMGMGMPGMDGMGGPGMGGPGMGGMGMPGGGGNAGPTVASGSKAKGFVIVIEGATPNRKGRAWLSPPEVKLERDKWGFITRLANLGRPDKDLKEVELNKNAPIPDTDYQKQQSAAAESLPFDVYTEGDTPKAYFDDSEGDYISVESGTVPKGIGVKKEKEKLMGRAQPARGLGGGSIKELEELIDPLTGETISAVYAEENGVTKVVDNQPVLINNDYWFRVQFKVKIKDQVIEEAPQAAPAQTTKPAGLFGG
ncbi:MAG: type IV pilus assembly protein PilM [Phycisphaerae bacterium]|nr:type IV pilus assembly protein PilM [Phycisphaerae bacterium]